MTPSQVTTGPAGAPVTDEGAPDRSAHPKALWDWLGRAGLAFLPVLLALTFYYRPLLEEGFATLPAGGDSDFYIYQTARMGDLGGRWWKLGDDELVGRPYPTWVARHPGLYEGLDLLLVSSVTARFLDPVTNYHFLILLVLAVNGWVAGWMALRLTRSYAWAALAVVLITLNMPTNMRMAGHLHLFKYGWVLLAVWAFFRYLDAPSPRRGVLLGLAVVWVLLSSFYFGFLLALVLGVWWLGYLVAGRLTRRHVLATVAAGATCAALAAALTFPIWTKSRAAGAAERENYFQRNREQLTVFSSDPWQYFVPPRWGHSKELLRPGIADGVTDLNEGWNYPGCVVLLAVGAYVVTRLRGVVLRVTDPRLLDRLVGLSAVCVVLSLTGGPAVLVYDVVPFFRAYGRAGLFALALWCVAAPAVLCGLTRQCSWLLSRGARRLAQGWPWLLLRVGWVSRLPQSLRRLAHQWPWLLLRGAIVAGALALALFEGNQYRDHPYLWRRTEPDPAWVGWLARQPADVRLAAFPFYGEDNQWYPFYLRLRHRHATLNGCELDPLRADLGKYGATLEKMTPEGLQFIASLGYNALAFDQQYLQAHGWIRRLPWLEPVDLPGDWSVYRVLADKLPSVEPASEDLHPLSVPLVPVATNQVTWKDGVIEGNGDDPYVVFALKAPLYVHAIRLTYSYGNAADAPATFQMFWRKSDENDFVETERVVTRELKVAPEEQTLTVAVNDVIDQFRIDPDVKPCVFKIKEITVLVSEDDFSRFLIPHVQRVARAEVPAGATVLVVGKVEDDLLKLEGRTAWGFPRDEGGGYAGNPADSAEAIARLEALRAKGGRYVLFPEPSFWWLEEYKEFKQHLDVRYTRVYADECCIIYRLSAPKLN
jgi:hypothetical protein